MMKRKNTDKVYDVFISHMASDEPLAESLATSLRASGLEPFTAKDVELAEDVSDALWQALAESKALIVILSRAELSPSMSVEIGAAQAWNKPIYGVVSDPASIRLPASLSHVRLVGGNAVEDIVREIKHSTGELSNEDRNRLRLVYSETGIPVDRFALNYKQLRKATDRFNRISGKRLSSERLLWEMLRMRKRGELPTLSRSAG